MWKPKKPVMGTYALYMGEILVGEVECSFKAFEKEKVIQKYEGVITLKGDYPVPSGDNFALDLPGGKNPFHIEHRTTEREWRVTLYRKLNSKW